MISCTVVMPPPLMLYKCPMPMMSCTVTMSPPLILYKCSTPTMSCTVEMPPPICLAPNMLILCEFSMLSCLTPLPLSILYNYAQNIWMKLISSPLLEFYIRTIFVILKSFDIVSENDFPLYKCLKINLALRRHFY